MKKNIFYTLIILLLLAGCEDKNAKGAIDSLKDKASEVASDAKNAAKDIAEKAVDATKDVATDAVDKVKNASSDALDAVKDAGAGAVELAKDTASDAIDASKDVASELMDETQDLASSASNSIKDASEDAESAVKNAASDATSKVADAATGGGNCSDVKVDFTFYGAPDKSYIVTKNTFKNITASGTSLEGISVEIDLMSIDTSADLNNGSAKWPAAMATVRDNNTKNSFFKKMKKGDGKVSAKVVKIVDGSADIEITMNGLTETVAFKTKTEGDRTVGTGTVDVAKFAPDAWKAFATVCKGFHKGMSHPEQEITFSVPTSCK